jgi:hypothetical protein
VPPAIRRSSPSRARPTPPHAPLTCSTPTATSIISPVRITARACRRGHPKADIALIAERAAIKNGIPKPMLSMKAITAPRSAALDVARQPAPGVTAS